MLRMHHGIPSKGIVVELDGATVRHYPRVAVLRAPVSRFLGPDSRRYLFGSGTVLWGNVTAVGAQHTGEEAHG